MQDCEAAAGGDGADSVQILKHADEQRRVSADLSLEAQDGALGC